MNETAVDELTCRFCQKTFRRQSTLSVHQCTKKRRWQEQNEAGVRLGYNVYLQFFTITQGSAKTKNSEDFMNSPYYDAFVKFGRYLHNIKAINPTAFAEWVIKNNKKLDQWCSEQFYEEYLRTYLRHENPRDALERSLLTAQKWADDNSSQFNHYFHYAAANRVCNDIANGRISPWIVYNCDSGKKFLAGLHDEQIEIIFNYIDPGFWQTKLKTYAADVLWIQGILKDANF